MADPESFGGLSASWALSLRARNRSDATIYSYLLSASKLEAFLLKADLPTDVTDIRREHVEAFIADQLANWSAGTAGVRYRSLQQLFGWLLDEGEIDENPMARTDPPSAPEVPVPLVSDADARKLLDACSGKAFEDRRDAAILRVFIDTPSRLGEVTGMTLDGVDLRDGVVRVLGKGRRERLTPLSPKAAAAIDRYLRARSRHRYATSPRLWLGTSGPMTASGITQMLKRRCRQAGIAPLHPHQFRHTFAHAWKATDGSDDDLMRLAGWRSRAMLARYGASAADQRAREAYRRRMGDGRL